MWSRASKASIEMRFNRSIFDGMTVQAFAESQRTSANNASVQLHRARKDLARRLTTVCGACAEHKCLDCTCRKSQLRDRSGPCVSSIESSGEDYVLLREPTEAGGNMKDPVCEMTVAPAKAPRPLSMKAPNISFAARGARPSSAPTRRNISHPSRLQLPRRR